MTDETRKVHDSLGELDIPVDAYYGAQTARAITNFPISGFHLPASFVRAQAVLKFAAAVVHEQMGLMKPDIAGAICQAAQEVANGDHQAWFQVDVYQAGAGTSQNMNVNEVIAARANELLTGDRGTGPVHANDDVNKSQSTNDTIHAAMQIAAMEQLAFELDPMLAKLIEALERKAQAFEHVVKAGRTHLQDAVPMRLGDEFGAWASNLRRHRDWLEHAAASLLEIGLGGNAVGTGINTPPGYAERVVEEVSEQMGLAFHLAENPFTFNQNPDEVVYVSGVLRSLALALQRIANDLRLLSSGPRTGLAEIELPPVQPGSSIMPGKVNPVMAEMLNMVAYQVQGCDTTVAQAGGAGQLELNVMMPVMAANFLHEIHILTTAMDVFADKCIDGITANEQQARQFAEHSLSLATALNVELGYEHAAKIVKEALGHDLSLREAAIRLGIEPSLIDKALNVEQLSKVVPRTAAAVNWMQRGTAAAPLNQNAAGQPPLSPETGD